jgi:hypothetical protein
MLRLAAVVVGVGVARPSLEGGHLEKREHGYADALPVERVILSEGRDAEDGEDVEDESLEEDDVGHGAEALDESLHDHLQLLHFADQLEEP